MSALNLDRMIYIVAVGHAGGDYFPEQNVSETDRATVVNDIVQGQYDDLKHVLECNPVEGTCRDVTEDIAWEVSAKWADRGGPLEAYQQDFIEAHLGADAANSFPRAA